MTDTPLPDWGSLIEMLQEDVAELASGVFQSEHGSITLSAGLFDTPAELSSRNSSGELQSWFFCLRYGGRPISTQMVVSESPELAALTMQQLVSLLNEWAPRRGFPPLFDAIAGSCPAMR